MRPWRYPQANDAFSTSGWWLEAYSSITVGNGQGPKRTPWVGKLLLWYKCWLIICLNPPNDWPTRWWTFTRKQFGNAGHGPFTYTRLSAVNLSKSPGYQFVCSLFRFYQSSIATICSTISVRLCCPWPDLFYMAFSFGSSSVGRNQVAIWCRIPCSKVEESGCNVLGQPYMYKDASWSKCSTYVPMYTNVHKIWDMYREEIDRYISGDFFLE